MERRLTFISLLTIAMLAAAVLAIAALLVKAVIAAPAGEVVVATMNGDDITAAELTYFAGLHRASVMEAFLAEEGVSMDRSFWQRDFGGITPIDKLRELAMTNAVAVKAELQLAQELGLTEDVSYTSLLETMKEENKRRARAVANGEPLYGPAEFEERTFIDFYRSKLETMVKESLANNGQEPDESELMSFYERVGTSISPMEDSLTYDLIAIPYRHEGKEEDKLREEALQAAAGIQERLLTGVTNVDEVLAERADSTGIEAAYKGELELNESNASSMYKSNNALYMALQAATKQDPITSVIDDRVTGQFIVARVTDWQAAERPSFDEIRDVVRKRYVEDKYSAHVKSRVEAAVVELYPAYYESQLGVE